MDLLSLSIGRNDHAAQPARQRLETLRVPKEHFDWALEQCSQAKKFQICPQFCPRLHVMHEQLRVRALAVILRGT